MIRYAHTNIIADDWKSLADFYIKTFECIPVPPERNLGGEWLAKGTGITDAKLKGVHLRLPGHGKTGPTLEIFQYNENIPQHIIPANLRGYGHIAFQVDDVPKMIRKVLQHGGSGYGEIASFRMEDAGYLTFVYVRDPEGNILELQSWE
jgi:catechol 2,3-dioxygenase-like lactoylglutathione lyase family enzyme